MNAQIASLGPTSAPPPQPQYRGVSRPQTLLDSILAREKAEKARYKAAVCKAPHLVSDEVFRAYQGAHPALVGQPRQTTEQAIDAAYAAQDLEALRWAIYEHIAGNPELAEVVYEEAIRSLPWRTCDNPLKAYDGRVPFSWFINMKTKSRYRDQLRKELSSQQRYVHLDSYEREPLLYNAVVPKSKELRYGLGDFLDTLSSDEREVADTCLAIGKERKGFRALVHKAKTWSPAVEEPEPVPTDYRLRVSPPYLPRPAGWHTTPLKAQACWSDPWRSGGRKRITAKPNSNQMKPIPSKLYMQVMTGSE